MQVRQKTTLSAVFCVRYIVTRDGSLACYLTNFGHFHSPEYEFIAAFADNDIRDYMFQADDGQTTL